MNGKTSFEEIELAVAEQILADPQVVKALELVAHGTVIKAPGSKMVKAINLLKVAMRRAATTAVSALAKVPEVPEFVAIARGGQPPPRREGERTVTFDYKEKA
jgi:hypothetical protein